MVNYHLVMELIIKDNLITRENLRGMEFFITRTANLAIRAVGKIMLLMVLAFFTTKTLQLTLKQKQFMSNLISAKLSGYTTRENSVWIKKTGLAPCILLTEINLADALKTTLLKDLGVFTVLEIRRTSTEFG